MIKIKKAGYQGIVLPEMRIGFDYSGRDADYLFISHAHTDHMPRNRSRQVFCTEYTYKLMKLRGYTGEAVILPFRTPVELNNARITLFPAGHILGSAMVYLETDCGNVLYTGDYRIPPSPATEGFECPNRVDYLITEATFSLPIYKWASYNDLAKEIRSFATQSLRQNKTPVFLAYNLGKAQEIMYMLAPLNRPMQIHDTGYKLCSVYKDANIQLGNYSVYDRERCTGHILIAPSSALRNGFASNVKNKCIAYCSGWASREATRTQMNVDKLIALSDHLDFFELVNFCRKLNPKKIYITHTPNASVVRHYLDKLKLNSTFLDIEAETDDRE